MQRLETKLIQTCLKSEVSVYALGLQVCRPCIHPYMNAWLPCNCTSTITKTRSWNNNVNLYADVKCSCDLWAFTNLPVGKSSDPGVHFHAALSDCKAIVGEAAQIECKVSREDCQGIWYKDGEEVSLGSKYVHCLAYCRFRCYATIWTKGTI